MIDTPVRVKKKRLNQKWKVQPICSINPPQEQGTWPKTFKMISIMYMVNAVKRITDMYKPVNFLFSVSSDTPVRISIAGKPYINRF